MNDRQLEQYSIDAFIKRIDNLPLGELFRLLMQASEWGEKVRFTPKGAFKLEDEWYVRKYIRFTQGFLDILQGVPSEQTLMEKEDVQKIKPILLKHGRISSMDDRV